MIILIVGSTGAGKTTYAKKLANQITAAVYSIDDWMKALYWQDMPERPDHQWFVENSKWYTDRISHCEDLILKSSIERAQRHENTILDLGFSTAVHRIKFIHALLNHMVVNEGAMNEGTMNHVTKVEMSSFFKFGHLTQICKGEITS